MLRSKQWRHPFYWASFVHVGVPGADSIRATLLAAASRTAGATDGPSISPPAAAPATSQGTLTRVGGIVHVPEGEFFYGCNEEVDKECLTGEGPGGPRSVSAFAIDRTEVTVEAYRRCVRAGRCTPPSTKKDCNWGVAGRERHPVNCVNHEHAAGYCAWRGARLPGELEWEKAARGTDGGKYPWGNERLSCDRAVVHVGAPGCARYSTWEVGAKPAGASPYGALDMAGNVWEWTADLYSQRGSRRHAVRGGSWYEHSTWVRASTRSRSPRPPQVGFRCAR